MPRHPSGFTFVIWFPDALLVMLTCPILSYAHNILIVVFLRVLAGREDWRNLNEGTIYKGLGCFKGNKQGTVVYSGASNSGICYQPGPEEAKEESDGIDRGEGCRWCLCWRNIASYKLLPGQERTNVLTSLSLHFLIPSYHVSLGQSQLEAKRWEGALMLTCRSAFQGTEWGGEGRE